MVLFFFFLPLNNTTSNLPFLQNVETLGFVVFLFCVEQTETNKRAMKLHLL